MSSSSPIAAGYELCHQWQSMGWLVIHRTLAGCCVRDSNGQCSTRQWWRDRARQYELRDSACDWLLLASARLMWPPKLWGRTVRSTVNSCQAGWSRSLSCALFLVHRCLKAVRSVLPDAHTCPNTIAVDRGSWTATTAVTSLACLCPPWWPRPRPRLPLIPTAAPAAATQCPKNSQPPHTLPLVAQLIPGRYR
jgi:hypothetical protein